MKTNPFKQPIATYFPFGDIAVVVGGETKLIFWITSFLRIDQAKTELPSVLAIKREESLGKNETEVTAS